jgi:cell division protein ZapA (FtsZ GTPase activity inhibitor)
MSCNDGEEQRLGELLSYVETHVSLLTEQFGQVGEDRLMLMASLMISDELWDLRDELEENARRAQAELRELAGIENRSGSAAGRSINDDNVSGEMARDGKRDTSASNAPASEDERARPSSDMDIGIDHSGPITQKRAYR